MFSVFTSINRWLKGVFWKKCNFSIEIEMECLKDIPSLKTSQGAHKKSLTSRDSSGFLIYSLSLLLIQIEL